MSSTPRRGFTVLQLDVDVRLNDRTWLRKFAQREALQRLNDLWPRVQLGCYLNEALARSSERLQVCHCGFAFNIHKPYPSNGNTPCLSLSRRP